MLAFQASFSRKTSLLVRSVHCLLLVFVATIREPKKNSHAAIKVHSVDTNCRIIFDTQIDVLADSEAEIPRRGEILLPQFILFDFQTALEDLFGFGTSDGHVDGDLLVTTDAECADGVTRFACCACRRCNGQLKIFGGRAVHMAASSLRCVRRSGETSQTYCRQEFDQTIAQAPLRHE